MTLLTLLCILPGLAIGGMGVALTIDAIHGTWGPKA